MKTVHEFTLSEETLNKFALKLLKLGEDEGFKPAELMMALRLTREFLEKQLGLGNFEITKHEVN